MLSQVVAIERGGHRGFAALAIELARPFLLGDRGLQERDVCVVAIRVLQLGECPRLRLHEHTAQLMCHDQSAQVVIANSVVRADLNERQAWILDQLMRDHIRQTTPRCELRLPRENVRRMAPLNSQSPKKDVSPPAPRIRAQPARRQA
jgi:hypothetical protein